MVARYLGGEISCSISFSNAFFDERLVNLLCTGSMEQLMHFSDLECFFTFVSENVKCLVSDGNPCTEDNSLEMFLKLSPEDGKFLEFAPNNRSALSCFLFF